MRVVDYISKKTIERWLEDYEYMMAGDVSPDAMPTNGGPKNYDGVGGSQLNKIMLDDAISHLSPLRRAVLHDKYIARVRMKTTCKNLEISPDVYKHRLEAAKDDIYRFLNREKADQVNIPKNIHKFLQKINSKG